VWLRPARRARGEQPALGRDQIVRAAIELLDAEGLPGLSMRRLGTKLGAGATSLYWHVANKDELLDLAIDEIWGEVYVPDTGDTSWRTAASVFATGMRTMLLRHPWVMSLLGVRQNIGPNAMRVSERAVVVFNAAGFTGMELAYASGLLTSHVIGSALSVAAVAETSRKTGVTPKQMVEDLTPYLDSIAEEHPQYHEWWQEFGGTNFDPEQLWDESFAFGLERVLDGLELWLARKDQGTPS
jgi:AcrR family transcriptional regulator